jgi:malonyl CoA-acyl carrier protein transacylase
VTVICLFPGQGSQSKGMGAELFERYSDWTAQADEILGYSIRELCVDDPRHELGSTAFTQPALYVVNAMTYRARQESGAAAPAFVAGHSLGEYDALLAAAVFDFDSGLRLVQTRGQLMGTVSGGGMAAVIGLEPDRAQHVLDGDEHGGRVDIANFNSFDQTVLAGPKEDLTALKPAFTAAGARAVIPLNVSAPFHSRYMRDVELEFSRFVEGFQFNPPAIPVISNVTGRPYEAGRVRETLSQQIGRSVRWLDSMVYLLNQPDATLDEIGPGSVLTKLAAQIKKRLAR